MEPVIDHDDAIVIVIVFVRVLVFFDDEGAEQPIRGTELRCENDTSEYPPDKP